MAWPLRDVQVPTEPAQPLVNKWRSGIPIVIDLGAHETRVGLAVDAAPTFVFPSLAAKYRDRRAGRNVVAVGYDVYLDPQARAAAKSPFDESLMVNWDAVEQIFDYAFTLLGVTSDGFVDSPVLVSEQIGAPRLPRATLLELLFKGYGVPAVALGVDAFFAYRYNIGAKPGVIVSLGHAATHVIPVDEHGVPDCTNLKRLDWGGRQATEFLLRKLADKYPYFPIPVTIPQAQQILHEHCYVARDYNEELTPFLSKEGLEDRERVIQAPYAEAEKEAADLEAIAERRRESGRRLQEKSAQARAEKRARQQADLEAYRQLQAADLDDEALLEHGLESQQQLDVIVRKLERTIDGVPEEDTLDQIDPAAFPLVDVPDGDLDSEGIKEKRRQKLMKGNIEARLRAKQEKAAAAAEVERKAAEDAQWRAADLGGWSEARRIELAGLQETARKRKKLRADLGDRKSLASQMLLKSVSMLAEEGGNGNGTSKKRRRKDDDLEDSFGADDNDWQVYRGPDDGDDSEEEAETERISELQQALLEHDPTFTAADLVEGRNWRDSLLHMFFHGPTAFNPEDTIEARQLHFNIERILVPEVLFQPSIARLDQAGIVEIIAGLLLGPHSKGGLKMAENIVLTGGIAKLPGLAERLHTDLLTCLPVGTPLAVKVAKDPLLDAWKGMAQWAAADLVTITKKDYENGETFKAHAYGNPI